MKNNVHASYIDTIDTPLLPQLLQVHHGNALYRLHVIRHRDIWIPPSTHPVRATHTHPVYHVALYLEGANEVSVGGQGYRCAPGDLLIVDPDMPHSLHVHTPEGHRRIVLTFEYTDGTCALRMPLGSVLSTLFGYTASENGPLYHLRPAARSSIAHAMRGLFRAFDVADQAAPAGVAVGLFVLFQLLGESLCASPPNAHRAQDGLLRAKRILERSFVLRLSVDELAEAAHCSPNYFITAFRDRFGQTPIAYQLSLRIRAAKNLLLASSLSAKEIAREVGFADAPYFARVFKKATGVSPIRFRREAHIAGEAAPES
jgi:AraC-like DNA-binding protein